MGSNVLKLIGNIIGNLIFALSIFVIAVLVLAMVQSRLSGGPPTVAGYQAYIVLSGSMNPAFDTGSLAFVKPADPAGIAVGDIITYRVAADKKTLVTHRVVRVNREGGELSFTTRGDANDINDQQPVRPENVIGRVTYTVPHAGYLMDFAQTKTGLVALIFVPGILIILFELRNLFRYAAEAEMEKEKEKAGNSTPV